MSGINSPDGEVEAKVLLLNSGDVNFVSQLSVKEETYKKILSTLC